jgi:hypothetical protein
MPRKSSHGDTQRGEERSQPSKPRPRPRPQSPEQLDWCDPNHELEAEPEPGDFDFEPDWDDE